MNANKNKFSLLEKPYLNSATFYKEQLIQEIQLLLSTITISLLHIFLTSNLSMKLSQLLKLSIKKSQCLSSDIVILSGLISCSTKPESAAKRIISMALLQFYLIVTLISVILLMILTTTISLKMTISA